MKKFWAILLAMMLVLSMVTVAGATEVEIRLQARKALRRLLPALRFR